MIQSKQEILIHCGFRIFPIAPIYSLEVNPSGGEKLKYLRFLRHDIEAIASAYCPIVFSPCKVLLF
mgnify:CR=1 FL=1